MKILQKYRELKSRRKIKAVIKKYNKAMTSFAEAAAELGQIMQERGNTSASLLSSIKEIQYCAKTALITEEDFKRGATNNGKR